MDTGSAPTGCHIHCADTLAALTSVLMQMASYMGYVTQQNMCNTVGISLGLMRTRIHRIFILDG